MQEKDILLREYLQDQNRFADLLNGFVFGGKRLVKPGDVQEMDGDLLLSPGRRLRDRIFIRKFRDVVKKTVFGVNFAVVGVENQDSIHYAMAIRNFVYDAAEYEKQLRKIRKEHLVKRDIKGAEFLSGFSKKDKVKVVVTITVYYGREEWHASRDLHGLLDWSDIPLELKEFVPNYRMNLLDINQFTNLDLFHTDIRGVFGFIQKSRDQKALYRFVKDNIEMFQTLEEDAYDVISAVTGDKTLIERKREYQTEGGMDMCKALEDMRNSCREEGILMGIEKGIEQGIEQGFEEGLSLGITHAVSIIKLLQMGYSSESIVKETGYDAETVEKVVQDFFGQDDQPIS